MAEVESLTHSGVHMHNLREMDDFYQNVLGASYTRLHSFATPGGSPATCLMLILVGRDEGWLYGTQLFQPFGA